MPTGSSRRRAFAPDGHRDAVAERLMKASLVVEGEVFVDAGFRLTAVGIASQIDVLVFQRAPDAFDEHVVHPASASVHRNANAGFDQHAGEGFAGELAALVGVEDLRPSLSKPCRIGPARPRAPPRRTTRRSCSTAARKEPPGSPSR